MCQFDSKCCPFLQLRNTVSKLIEGIKLVQSSCPFCNAVKYCFPISILLLLLGIVSYGVWQIGSFVRAEWLLVALPLVQLVLDHSAGLWDSHPACVSWLVCQCMAGVGTCVWREPQQDDLSVRFAGFEQHWSPLMAVGCSGGCQGPPSCLGACWATTCRCVTSRDALWALMVGTHPMLILIGTTVNF